MMISGERTKQLVIIAGLLPRHWLYEWFSQFCSCGTYSVLSRSHSITAEVPADASNDSWVTAGLNTGSLGQSPVSLPLSHEFMYLVTDEKMSYKQIGRLKVPHNNNMCSCIHSGGHWDMGYMHHQAMELVQEIGRRTANITGDVSESTFLFQQLSVALQRGNAVSCQNMFTAS